jgi:hypothetical protein
MILGGSLPVCRLPLSLFANQMRCMKCCADRSIPVLLDTSQQPSPRGFLFFKWAVLFGYLQLEKYIYIYIYIYINTITPCMFNEQTREQCW